MNKTKPLKNKISLVTGASRGIGKNISLALASEGSELILAARTVDKLEEVKKDIDEMGGKARVIPVDLSDKKSISRLFNKIREDHGRLDILVNNAAIGIFGDFTDLTEKDFNQTIDTNVKGIFFTCKEALKFMIPQRSGYIINISSIQGVKGYKQQSIYAASKHAIMGISKSLAVEVQEYNIRVSAILPGGVDTEFISEVRPDLDKSVLIKPDDIAKTVLYLISLSDTAMVDQVIIRRFTSTPFNA